jgi:hypothetical protein
VKSPHESNRIIFANYSSKLAFDLKLEEGKIIGYTSEEVAKREAIGLLQC